MENYIVSARKYRPKNFDEVVGQQHVTATLHNAIKNNHLAQALLFTGPRGVGKTTSARILARLINSDGQTDADQDFSFNVFELDAASNNSVEDIRSLIDQVRFAPQTGKYKVYIIDEVHMLSQAAFNAFLKTLEEPPKHAIFILATTEKHKIIPTILSRCQIYDFKRISVDDALEHLKAVADKEGVSYEEQALRIIAQKADGAMRDALSIFDRIVSFSGDHVSYKDVIDNLRILDYDYYFRTIDLTMAQDHAGLFRIFQEILENGFDGHLFMGGLAAHCRDLLVAQNPETLDLVEGDDALRERYGKQAQAINSSFLLRSLKSLSESDVRYKGSNNKRLLVELTLMEMAAHWKNTTGAGDEKKKSELNHRAQSQTPAPAAASPASPKPVVPKEFTDSTPPSASASEFKAPKPEEEKAAPKPAVKAEPETKVQAPAAKPEANDQTESDSQARLKGNLRKKRSRISISDTLSGKLKPAQLDRDKEEETDPNAPELGKPQDPLDAEKLQAIWEKYLAQSKLNDQPKILATLKGKPLSIHANFTVEVTLDNTLQESTFQSAQRDLLQFCRKELNNYSLSFKTKIVEGSQKLEPYSAEERYHYLLKKNRHLATLKDQLGLDIS
jgi:DNA polymerase-3 subunit gamma/tau